MSYAQEGEDLVVHRLLGHIQRGFYIDIGSHHPFRFSNTYLLYRRHWHGLCVDPLPGSASLFNRWRPRDIAVEMGVSEIPSSLNYYLFNEPALNTFDAALAEERSNIAGYRIIGKREIMTDTLASIILSFLPLPIPAIDLLSVDVEGFDLQVLRSNDWDRFRPSVVIAECLDTSLETIRNNETANFLLELGYRAYAKTGHSVIFSGLL
jgi:FkbM family methyltransferase